MCNFNQKEISIRNDKRAWLVLVVMFLGIVMLKATYSEDSILHNDKYGDYISKTVNLIKE
jgi:hypothetical protein